MSGYYYCDSDRLEPTWGLPCIYHPFESTFVTKSDALWVHPALDLGASVTELWAIGSDVDSSGLTLGNASGTGSCYCFFQLDGSSNWKNIASSARVQQAVRKDGTMWTWGDDTGYCYGALGNNASATSRYSTPVQVITGTTWLCVSGNGYNFVGLKTDNTMFAWGYNGLYQVGDGSTVNRSSPVQVSGTACWSKVCVGTVSVVAMRIDGSVWTWGVGYCGQLGNNSNANVSTPVQVCGMSSGVREIIAGSAAHFAIKNDGTLWAWGDNECGSLGIGSTISVSTPVQVGDNTFKVKSLMTTCRGAVTALTCDGKRYYWGRNGTDFLLGNGSNDTTETYCAPTLASDGRCYMTLGKGMACGAAYAIGYDGSLWGWGKKYLLNGGDGNDTTSALTPIQVGTDKNWVSITNAHCDFPLFNENRAYGLKQGRGGYLS